MKRKILCWQLILLAAAQVTGVLILGFILTWGPYQGISLMWGIIWENMERIFLLPSKHSRFFSATFATELFLTGWMTGWQKFSFFVTNFIPNSFTRIDCPFLLKSKTVSPSPLFKLFFFHGHLVQGSRSCCGIVARWATSLTPSSTPCTTTAPPSSASTLGGLFTDKSKVGNILQVDGNCARPLWSGRQLMRGGKTWKGFRSSWFYPFPLTLYSLHYLSFLFTPNHQNDQRHNDKTYLRPQNSHFSFACIVYL